MMARRSGLEGEVTIEITVDSDGMPTDCRVLPPFSHRILEESAIRAVKNARFQPGTRNGQPAACTYSIKVRFELSPENA
jgi:protein TonB